MKLYIAHLGFYDSEIGGMYELHTNVLIVAKDAKEAKNKIKNKNMYINKMMHIDGLQEILEIDGYEIILKKSDENLINRTFSHDELKLMV